MQKKPRILVCLGHYLPGYKSGGPVRSIVNLIEHLHENFDFRILTTDRDLGDGQPYSSIKSDAWNAVGAVKVYYASPGTLTLKKIASLIRETPHDILYLNSFFSFRFSILPLLARRLRMVPHRPVVLAPRGQFSEGALDLKSRKKRAYLIFAKASGLISDVTWQSSSTYEAADIRRELGCSAGVIRVATNLPRRLTENKAQIFRCEEEGPLRVVFLSRISPMKNLCYAINVLSRVRMPVRFNIYGPLEDESYWHECQKAMACVPEHIDIAYKGAIASEKVAEIMRAHDLFFFPTHGENYGHVIAESLSVGTPVLVSDQTPWRDLSDDGLGWDLELENMTGFVEIINLISVKNKNLTQKQKTEIRRDIQKKAIVRLTDPAVLEANRQLFTRCLHL